MSADKVSIDPTVFWALSFIASIAAQVFTLWLLKTFREFRERSQEFRLVQSSLRGSMWCCIVFASIFYGGSHAWVPIEFEPSKFPSFRAMGWVVIFSAATAIPIAAQLLRESIFKRLSEI